MLRQVDRRESFGTPSTPRGLFRDAGTGTLFQGEDVLNKVTREGLYRDVFARVVTADRSWVQRWFRGTRGICGLNFLLRHFQQAGDQGVWYRLC